MLQSAQPTQSESSFSVGAAGGTRSTMILLYHLSTLPTYLLACLLATRELVANLGSTMNFPVLPPMHLNISAIYVD